MEAYLAVTSHFIMNEELKSCVLSVRCLDGRHTADNLVTWITEITEDYSIMSKVIALVTDNAANMAKARSIFEDKCMWASIGCTAHTLQLCLQEGFKIRPIENVLASARRLVQHFKRSEVALSALQRKISDFNTGTERNRTDCCKLIIDVATRWNSTYQMVERLSKLRWPVLAVLSDETIVKKSQASTLSPTDDAWRCMKSLADFLALFSEATDVVGAEKYVSASIRAPLIKGLKRHLLNTSGDRINDVPCIRGFRECVSDAMHRRMTYAWDDVLMKATAMDPRHKLNILSTQDKELLKAEICREAQQLQSNHQQPPNDRDSTVEGDSAEESSPPAHSGLDIFSLAHEGSESDASVQSDKDIGIEYESRRYFSPKLAPPNVDPIKWWGEKREIYPN